MSNRRLVAVWPQSLKSVALRNVDNRLHLKRRGDLSSHQVAKPSACAGSAAEWWWNILQRSRGQLSITALITSYARRPPTGWGQTIQGHNPRLRHWEAASMGKNAKKRPRRRVLRLPDLDHSKAAVLNSLRSPASRRAYEFALNEFIAWYCSEPRLAFNRVVVLQYRLSLEARGLAASSINQRLAAVRRLAYEASDSGLLGPELAAGIRRVKGVRQLGNRSGNWLTLEQCSDLLKGIRGEDLRAKRNRAIISTLVGCGLRRTELVELRFESIQMRQGRWAIVDLVGKGGHIRTVPIPQWVKQELDSWTSAAGIMRNRIFRAVSRNGSVWGTGVSPNVIWAVVRDTCKIRGIDHVAAHDLRRTCAKLCHGAGGELEQIQFLLGHVSVQTTERYLGCKQNLRSPVNERFVPL